MRGFPGSSASYHDIAMVVSVESIVTTLGRFPHGIVDIVPAQLPTNFLARAGVAVEDARGDGDTRSVFDSITRFDFGFADCSGGGVGFSVCSTIGAGERCAIIKIDNKTIRKRRDLLTGAIAVRCNI